MRYRIRHRSRYGYAREVQLSYHALHLSPRDMPGQRVLSTRLVVEPTPATVQAGTDYFGNPRSLVTLTEPHDRLVVDAHSEVEVCLPAPSGPGPAWERVRDALERVPDALHAEAVEFRFPSAMAAADPDAAAYAARCFPPGTPLLEGVRELTRRIHADFEFDPGATSIGTPVSEVMACRRGVCQDFAQVQLSGLRSLGLAARYNSGYIRNDRAAPAPALPPGPAGDAAPGPELARHLARDPGAPHAAEPQRAAAPGPEDGGEELVGADASHAWVSVFCPGEGWIHYDPTNDLLARESHVVLGWGRDYRDVSPISGILMGGGEHTLEVEVSVRAVRAPSDPAGQRP